MQCVACDKYKKACEQWSVFAEYSSVLQCIATCCSVLIDDCCSSSKKACESFSSRADHHSTSFVRLQHTATYYKPLQHATTHRNTGSLFHLRCHNATHTVILQHNATHYNTLQQRIIIPLLLSLQDTATYWNTMQCNAAHCKICKPLQQSVTHSTTLKNTATTYHSASVVAM